MDTTQQLIDALAHQIDCAYDCDRPALAAELEAQRTRLVRALPQGTFDPSTIPDPLEDSMSILG